ncbi:hypothetical protein V6R21_08015 [Limibacter armeniacum]|uniref:hypothetical protein n=1 Tax=Limibacter armeniacum TaxID=466084 RepID=UPI002FE5EB11
MNSIIKILLILIMLKLFSSCSRTVNLNLSKSEIKNLDTIYYKKTNHKVFDAEWLFLDKNICQYSTTLIRKKTYTGTWSKVGDSLKVNFFYEGKNKLADRMIAIETLEIKR